MSEKLITEMSAEEFDEVIETFITRETQRVGEIDAPLFYEALEEIFAQPARQITQPSSLEEAIPILSTTPEGGETLVTLEAHVVGKALQLNVDVDNSTLQAAPYVNVQNNQS